MPTPEDNKALRRQAHQLNLQEKYNAVISLLDDTKLKNLGDPVLMAEKAWAYKKLDVTDDGLKYIQMAGAQTTTLFVFLNSVGNLLIDEKDFAAAIDFFNWSIQLAPRVDYLFYNRGRAYLLNGELNKAIEDNLQALQINPASDLAYNNIGIIHYNQKNYTEAISYFSKAISANPGQSLGFYNRGLCYLDTGNLKEALADFKEAAGLDKSNPNAVNNHGVVLLELGQYEDALKDFEKALAIDPAYTQGHYNIAIVFLHKKQFAEAIKELDIVLASNPMNAAAYIKRAEAHEQTGDFAKALDDYRQAATLYDNPTYLQAKIDELKLKLGNAAPESSGSATSSSGTGFLKTIGKIQDTSHIETIRNFAFELSNLKSRIMKLATPKTPIDVAHYTKLFVADALCVPAADTFLRYSNITNMNDPEEGKIFREVLTGKDPKGSLAAYFEEIKLFNKGDSSDNNIYLGSFLPASTSEEERINSQTHEDELVMWRTYGKGENQEEAAGCSIVIDRGFFYWPPEGATPAPLQMQGSPEPDPSSPNRLLGQRLFRVFYYNKARDNFENEDTGENNLVKQHIEELKALLLQMLDTRQHIGEKEAFDNMIYRELSELRCFFKSANYAFEKEYRVIQYCDPDNEKVTFDPNDKARPRVLYVESSNPVASFIKRIYLGPRVARPERWMYLEVALRKNSGNLSAKVFPSSCKFQ